MNIRTILNTLVIAASLFCLAAPASASVKDAHAKMHQSQLAKAKMGMDKTVIAGMLKNDIARREAAVPGLSAESAEMINDLLKEAHTHIGKPYRHGMKGPSAFDCSGFSSYVYRQFGYKISPSSRTQYTEGVSVNRKDLRKGDLVFFTSRSSGNNVGHVGIVVSADNESGDFKFIHASIRGVKVNTCEGYYEGRYIGARRIITE